MRFVEIVFGSGFSRNAVTLPVASVSTTREMVFELEGEPPRVIKAGEAFWEPGGDVIHYQDGNNRTDIPVRFLATMNSAHTDRTTGPAHTLRLAGRDSTMPAYPARSGTACDARVRRAPLHLSEPDQRDTSLFYDPSHSADPAVGDTR